MKRRVLGAVGTMLILAVVAMAKFAYPGSAPIDRLITNTTAYIREKPGDPMGPYTLARIHYLALATRAAQLAVYETTPAEVFPQRPIVSEGETFRPVATPVASGAPGVWTEAQLREHLTLAVENYRKALQMDAKNPLFHLGLASVSEAALTAGFKLGQVPGATLLRESAPVNGDFTPLWREQAIGEYLRAYELSVDADTALRSQPLHGIETLVSYEAAQHYVSMVSARGVRDLERENVSKARSTLAALAAKPFGGITPIVFRLSGAAPLEDLLDSSRVVTFDLDGTRRPQRYAWVRPDTAILVWDPAGSGRITSGHQLFGSVTFNMFWSDGYRALDALDDNRDGAIAADELDGLALWFDRNQDGVSQTGEVVAIGETDIVSISTRAAGRSGESLTNPEGLATTDGRVLPTYDWTTEALDPDPQPRPAIPST